MSVAMSVFVTGTVKNLKWRLVFTKTRYSACCSSSLCLKPCHASSALGSPARTFIPMTLLSSLNCISCIYSVLFPVLPVSKSRASWHVPQTIQQWYQGHRQRGSSQGNPEQNSRNKASSTMMKSSRLSTQPWWTLTFTLNSSLYSSPTRTWVGTLAYIPCTTRTIHSSTPSFLGTHQMTFWGTPSDTISRSTKAM